MPLIYFLFKIAHSVQQVPENITQNSSKKNRRIQFGCIAALAASRSSRNCFGDIAMCQRRT